jgi:hypothetical protein
METKPRDNIACIITALLIFIAVAVITPLKCYGKITTSDTVTAATTAILAIITAYYAIQTRMTVKVMREQMYNNLRPVIDFLDDDDKTPINIGAGAAIDVITYQIKPHAECRSFRPYGTITPNEHLLESNRSERAEFHLAMRSYPRAKLWAYKIEAVYCDVYGRHFKSSRKAYGDSKFSPLNNTEIPEEEWQQVLKNAHKEEEAQK